MDSQNSHRDADYSSGTIINNIVITMCEARWVLEASQEPGNILRYFPFKSLVFLPRWEVEGPLFFSFHLMGTFLTWHVILCLH